MDLKQPFSLTDIRKYPREVLIAFLIGLIIYFINKADKTSTECGEETTRLNARIDTINSERLKLYDRVLFQEYVIKKQNNKMAATDSLLRSETQPQVEKLLQ